MTAVNVDRMRRYIDRTDAASKAAAWNRRNAEATARGEHCAVCAENPQVRALHAAFAPLVKTLRAFGGES